MQIFHIVNTISKGSGVMELLMSYFRNMDNTTFNFVYMKDAQNDYSEEIESLGGSVTKYSDLRRSRAFRNLNSVLLTPDIIHNHIAVHSNWISKTMESLYGVPMIVHAHSNRLSNTKIKAFRNKLLITNIRNQFDHYWGCSKESCAVWFGQKVTRSNNSWIMPNAIECSLIKDVVKSYGTTSDSDNRASNKPIVIGSIGRLSKEKNHKFLLRVVSEMKKSNPSIILKIIGEGPERYTLEEEIKQKKLVKNVILLGNLNREQLFKEITSFDIFMFPSFFEGFGTALLEVQGFNVSCISSNKVPTETDMGKVEYLSGYNVKKWSQAGFKALAEQEAIKFNTVVSSKGYCIEIASKVLREKYLEILEQNK